MSHGADDGGARAALVAALKRKLATTPLHKVTVAGLAADAGVARQAFYYHFDDVYDAATWVFTTEVADHIFAHAEYDRWADGFLRLLVYMRAHRTQTLAVLDSLTWRKTEKFFHATFLRMMRSIVEELEAGQQAEEERARSDGKRNCTSRPPFRRRLSDEDRDFIAEHYALAVLGHLLHWLATGMKDDPVRLVDKMQFVMRGHVVESLERFRTGNAPE